MFPMFRSDDHRRDEPAERPAEDGDDRVFLGAAPAAPHEQRDHEAGSCAAEHSASGREEAVDVALAFGEGARRWKLLHALSVLECSQCSDLTTIAAMNPPSDQPKMVTIVCSSERLQPPHMSSATMKPEAAPQNIPPADAKRP